MHFWNRSYNREISQTKNKHSSSNDDTSKMPKGCDNYPNYPPPKAQFSMITAADLSSHQHGMDRFKGATKLCGLVIRWKLANLLFNRLKLNEIEWKWITSDQAFRSERIPAWKVKVFSHTAVGCLIVENYGACWISTSIVTVAYNVHGEEKKQSIRGNPPVHKLC